MADQVVDVVGKVVAAGAISANAHGNVSLRVPLGDEMYFTGRRSFATAHLRWWLASASTGSFARDSFPPSRAPCVAMHAAIYALRPDVGSMIHAHSPFATASQDGVPHHSGGLHPEHPLGITCYQPVRRGLPLRNLPKKSPSSLAALSDAVRSGTSSNRSNTHATKRETQGGAEGPQGSRSPDGRAMHHRRPGWQDRRDSDDRRGR